ncbi:hypothetical protein HPG69_016202 [Diceros bicornis minor]|uniref:Keratin-associated protein n=1 Tax=Diceros bicornis minor TaxID=77932 RepID=A0A7J7FHM6_DICBM|nr:hypothetical protein HPG69_016202 [Diceros bicornis minor]
MFHCSNSGSDLRFHKVNASKGEEQKDYLMLDSSKYEVLCSGRVLYGGALCLISSCQSGSWTTAKSTVVSPPAANQLTVGPATVKPLDALLLIANCCSRNYSSHSLGNSCHAPVTSPRTLYSTEVSCGDAPCSPSSSLGSNKLHDSCHEPEETS